MRDGVSNHRCLDCLLNRLFMRKSKKISKLCVTGHVRGIHRWPVNSPHKGPVTRKMFSFDDLILEWIHGCHYDVAKFFSGSVPKVVLDTLNTPNCVISWNWFKTCNTICYSFLCVSKVCLLTGLRIYLFWFMYRFIQQVWYVQISFRPMLVKA